MTLLEQPHPGELAELGEHQVDEQRVRRVNGAQHVTLCATEQRVGRVLGDDDQDLEVAAAGQPAQVHGLEYQAFTPRLARLAELARERRRPCSRSSAY